MSQGLNRQELQRDLEEELQGIRRPPLLLLDNPQAQLKVRNLHNYEISQLEPLHDIKNLIQMLITEIKSAASPTLTATIEQIQQGTFMDKNEIRGCDWRFVSGEADQATEKPRRLQ